MMTKEELVEWMGMEDDDCLKSIKVVIDCPSPQIAKTVSDAIVSIMGGSYDVWAGEGDWWRYLWLCESEFEERFINAYSSGAEDDFVKRQFDDGVILDYSEALAIILNSSGAVAVDDLL